MLEDRRTVTVGLDVHKSSVRLAAMSCGEVLRERTLAYDHDELLGEIGAWPGARVGQEAGPTGFELHRALLAAGVDSVIVAPGLVPSRPGDRVKTDKRDARRLAGLHAAGLLTEIYVPTREHEALRDLVRAREDARLDRMRARHRLGKVPCCATSARCRRRAGARPGARGWAAKLSSSPASSTPSMTTCSASTRLTGASRASSARSTASLPMALVASALAQCSSMRPFALVWRGWVTVVVCVVPPPSRYQSCSLVLQVSRSQRDLHRYRHPCGKLGMQIHDDALLFNGERHAKAVLRVFGRPAAAAP